MSLLMVLSTGLSTSAIPTIAHAAVGTVTIEGKSGSYVTVNDAMANVVDGDTIVVDGDIVEPTTIEITKSVTLKAGGNGGSITSDAKRDGILSTHGKSLTLGGGTPSPALKFIQRGSDKLAGFASTRSIAVHVTKGEFHLRDGFDISFDNTASIQLGVSLGTSVKLFGQTDTDDASKTPGSITGDITGGTITTSKTSSSLKENKSAIYIREGAQLSRISGGQFFGQYQAIDISGAKIDKISGGVFETDSIDRYSAYFTSKAHVREISGGDFIQRAKGIQPKRSDTTGSGAVNVTTGARIDTISGGNFTCPSGSPTSQVGFTLYGGGASVGVISGGIFSGDIALWAGPASNRTKAGAPFTMVDSITGGTFTGGAAKGSRGAGIVVDAGSKIGAISGGKMTGDEGIRVVGVVDSLSGDVQSIGTNYGLNLYSAYQPQAQIGEIMGGLYQGGSVGINNVESGNMGNYPRGSIGTIGGSTQAVSTAPYYGYGLQNAGTIDSITNGRFEGSGAGLYAKDGLNGPKGHTGPITGGTFFGNKAMKLGHVVKIEPQLTDPVGTVLFLGLPLPNNNLSPIEASPDILKASLPSDYVLSPIVKRESSFYSGLGSVFYPLVQLGTVKFDANGGAPNPAMEDVVAGVTGEITLPQVTYDPPSGHEFAGWATEPGGPVQYADKAQFTVTEGTTTLYAQWTPKKFAVSFDSNGGEGSMADRPVSYGDTFTVPASEFTRQGYTFTGWNTQADGQGAAFQVNDVIDISDDVTLYAQWVINTYTLTLDDNYPGGAINSQTASFGDTVTLSHDSPVRTGYTFTGWNTAKDGTGTPYQAGASVKVEGDLTLYAQWEVNSHTVSYQANGGQGSMAPVSTTYGSDFTVADNEFTRRGHHFTGWNTKADGSGTAYQPNDVIHIDSDVELFAQWVVNDVIVTLDPNGAPNVAQDIPTTYTSTFTVPDNPFSWSGHQFTGWNTQPDGTGKAFQPGDSFVVGDLIEDLAGGQAAGALGAAADDQGDVVLYAQWVPDMTPSPTPEPADPSQQPTPEPSDPTATPTSDPSAPAPQRPGKLPDTGSHGETGSSRLNGASTWGYLRRRD